MVELARDLPVLREWWGTDYEINWDFRTRTFRAMHRRDGRILESTATEELWQMIRADQIERDG